MNYISLASGIEAASVAFMPLGWKPIAFAEIEPFPCAVLKHHYPEVPNHGDLAAFDWSVYRGKADAVCAGFPCQAFSIAGLGKSLEDARGNLSIIGVKAIRLIRPKWVLLEQVPGVLSKPDNPFGCILAGLCGADAPLLPGTKNGKWSGSGVVLPANKDSYGLAWRVLDAQHFGVPQRRRRVFVVGYLGDWRPAAEVLFEPKGLRRDSAEGGEKGEGTSACFEVGPGGNRQTSIAPTVDTKSKNGPIQNQVGMAIVMAHGQGGAEILEGKSPCLSCNHEAPIAFNWQKTQTEAIAFKIRGGCEGGGKGYLGSEDKAFTISTTEDQHIFAPKVYENHGQDSRIKEVDKAPQLNAKAGTGGGNLPLVQEPVTYDLFNVTVPKCFTQNQCGDVLTGDIAPSMGTNCNATGRNTAKVNYGATVRRLTPTEAERLQGFPDGYTAIPWKNKPVEQCPDGPRYKALGNSWAVPCARWIGKRIAAVEANRAGNPQILPQDEVLGAGEGD